MRHSDTSFRAVDSRTLGRYFPFSGSDERGMARRFGVSIVIGVLLAAGIAWAGATVGARFYADYVTGRALKPFIADGRRLVPVRRHEHMRGDARQDYWCFADSLCVYAIEVFRRLYPAYNDLDDDALLSELRGRNAYP
jgi:hypothetical protein